MLGVINVILAPIFIAWCYKSHFRKKDLLQNSKILKNKKKSSAWSYRSHSRTNFFECLALYTHYPGVIASHISGILTTPSCMSPYWRSLSLLYTYLLIWALCFLPHSEVWLCNTLQVSVLWRVHFQCQEETA